MFKLSTYVVAVTVLAALALCPVAAKADSTDTFYLTVGSDNSSPGGALNPYPAPYASVTVDLTSSTTAVITFTGLTTGGYTYYMADGKAIGLNINATSVGVSNLVDPGSFNGQNGINGAGINGICVPGQYSCAQKGAETFDHLRLPGTFNFWINNNEAAGQNGYPLLVSTISFTIKDLSGTWNYATDVLVANSTGLDAASHMFAVTGQCLTYQNNSPGGCGSGYAGGLSPVPEPPVTVLLACSALLFGGCFLRRPLYS